MSLHEEWWFLNEKEGWPQFQTSYVIPIYFEMLEFIEQHVENPYRHCRWTVMLTSEEERFMSVFRFRYERDYIKFVLRWS